MRKIFLKKKLQYASKIFFDHIWCLSSFFLSGALLSFGIGHANISWEKSGVATLMVISSVQGTMLIWMSETKRLTWAYLSYVVFRTIHPVMITVASAEVAERIRKDSYGLIFGLNTFIAFTLQTILTFVVSDMKGLALDQRSQYFVYGICFIILGLLIGATSATSWCFTLFSGDKKKEQFSEVTATDDNPRMEASSTRVNENETRKD